MLVVLIGVSTWLQFVVVIDLQMLTFDGVWHFRELFSSRMNPGFHCTGQMADSVHAVVCGWAVCWCQHCGSSGPWWWWGYDMGRRIWWTTNTGAFYWWHFECRDTVTRSWGPLLCHSSTTITSCCKDLYTIPEIWKHPSSCMASILTGQVTHWACLGCSASAYTTACSSSCQYPVTSHSHWRGVDQHYTGHNQQPDQLYVKELCCVRQMVVTLDTDWFTDWSGHSNTVKLHIIEWPFIVASLRHTCAIIMLSNQHLDMPDLWGGWIISAKEKCSLTQI